MKFAFILSNTTVLVLSLATVTQAAFVTALTDLNQLVTFDTATPGIHPSTNSVTGLIGGDALVGIDYRPIDSLLIGLGYNTATGAAHVYSITSGGVATSINANTLTFATGLARVTADFNPTANALRIVTSAATGNNLRIPTGGTGVLTTDTDLNPANTGIRATAYARNNAGGGTSGATTLYEIDGTNNSLIRQGSIDFFTGSGTSPNTGTLTAVGGLTGVTGSTINGFDIFNDTSTAATFAGTAYLATDFNFFTLNLGTGAATSVGNFALGGTRVLDIAVAVPEPSSLALCGLAIIVALRGNTRQRLKRWNMGTTA